MSNYTFVETRAWSPGADGPTLTASTTATSILHASAKFQLPANEINSVGRIMNFRIAGRTSTVTTPGTLSFFIRAGAVNVWSSGAITLNATAKTNVPWLLEGDLDVRTIGASTTATMLGILKFMSEAVVGSPATTAGGIGVLLLPVSAPAVGSGFDSTAPQTIDLFAQYSISNANSITEHQSRIQLVN